MESFFENYDKAWIRGDIDVRQRIQRAIFPKGLTYESPDFRTPELALPFSVIGEANGSKTTMVTLTTLTSNTLIQLLNDWQQQNLLQPIEPKSSFRGNYLRGLES